MSKRVSHRLLAVVVVAATVAGALAPASTAGALAAPAAPRPIAVWLNGTRVSFDVPPTAEGGRTLVPVRAIFEAMGAKVDWDQATRTATAVKDDLTIRL